MSKLHSHHGGGHTASIDRLAHQSRLRPWNSRLKLAFCLLLLIVCVSLRNPAVSLFLVVSVGLIVWRLGGTPLKAYVSLLRIPLFFILVGVAAIVVEVARTPVGDWQLRLGGLYLCTSVQQLCRGGQVASTALGAVSAMYLLALTMPVHELTTTLSRAHVPDILVELMYLIYRFIFVLSETARQMRVAAQSRLGYWGWRQSLQTFGKSMANLLVVALRQAGDTYDAMTARCYDGRLEFLVEEQAVKPAQLAAALGYLACVAGIWLATRRFL